MEPVWRDRWKVHKSEKEQWCVLCPLLLRTAEARKMWVNCELHECDSHFLEIRKAGFRTVGAERLHKGCVEWQQSMVATWREAQKVRLVSWKICSWKFFKAFSQNFEYRLLVSSYLSVCSSAHMEKLGSHWTNFNEIWCDFSKICRENSSYTKIRQG